jgi:hypothetical protein
LVDGWTKPLLVDRPAMRRIGLVVVVVVVAISKTEESNIRCKRRLRFQRNKKQRNTIDYRQAEWKNRQIAMDRGRRDFVIRTAVKSFGDVYLQPYAIPSKAT